jgi:putative NADH-flavin reductase
MKIGVIGATGKAGGLIAEEAEKRGHEITAIVRDREKVNHLGWHVLERDIFSLTTEDLKDFDVVVDAFGTPYGKGVEIQHQTSMMTLISALEPLPNVRLMVVGGAGSLYADNEGKHRVIENIPAEYQAVPFNMAKAFENLQSSKVNWTYFSPASLFDPKGPRTGTYKLGTDYMILNDEGESYLSYNDYAIAMVDEIENKKFIKKRFTAVSNKNISKASVSKKKEMPKVVFEGLSQYRGPLVYELAGKNYYLIMDDGTEGTLSFVSGENLTWFPKYGSPVSERYECLKADEDTYLVNWEVTDAKPRTGVSLVLDLEQSLVTAVIAQSGTNRRFPNLVTNQIVFGAIKLDGRELPFKRHGFTSDLVGKRISWRYNPEMSVTHVYFDSHYIRVAGRPGMENSPMAIEMRENPYDEPCHYIKIKKHIYLVSFLEDHLTFRGKTGNNMLILMNSARLHDVGRSFGLGQTGMPENYMFSAVGQWMESDGSVESEPSKYRV